MILYILNCISQWIVTYRQVQLRVVQKVLIVVEDSGRNFGKI